MRIKLPLFVICLMLAGSTALATPITFSLTSSLLTALPGATVTFSATLTETGGSSTFLNGDIVNIAAPLLADDTLFFLNFPLSLSPLQSFTASILSVTVPAATPAGLYSGSLAILGGSTPSALNTLGTQPFAVNVVSSTTIPEPDGTVLVLLGAGASLACGVGIRGHKMRIEN
jgi:hypothetical protein